MTSTPTLAEIIAWHEAFADAKEAATHRSLNREQKDVCRKQAAMHRATVEMLKLIKDVAIPALESRSYYYQTNMAKAIEALTPNMPDFRGLADQHDEAAHRLASSHGSKLHRDSAAALRLAAEMCGQMPTIYTRLCEIVRLCQTHVDDLDATPRKARDLRDQIFGLAEEAQLLTGNWAPLPPAPAQVQNSTNAWNDANQGGDVGTIRKGE